MYTYDIDAQADTLVFEGRRDTEVHLLSDSGHVAMSKAAEVVPMVVAWLRRHLPALPSCDFGAEIRAHRG